MRSGQSTRMSMSEDGLRMYWIQDNDFLERKQKIEIPAAKAKLLRAQVEKDVEV